MNNVASKNLSLHQMKLKKYPLKMNNSNQNLNLSKLKYQKKFHIDWKDMIRKSTQKKEKTKKKVKNWQKSVLLPERTNLHWTNFTNKLFKTFLFLTKKDIYHNK